MATVTFRRATRIFPGLNRPAVNALDLAVDDGEFLVLVGPSGCGKSTALRMLAGLEPVDQGSVWIGDRDVTFVPPKDRDIAMVFQTYALYPNMTVAENIGFHLKITGVPEAEREQRVLEAAKLLDLEEHLHRKPAKLSGGQRQRVAMGRAIVRHPHVFLMDEPLSNLDAKLRVQTRTQIAALQRRLGVTTIYVTHDQVEAMTMGDRVAVVKDGILQQCASPHDLFATPVNEFVAGFIGSPAMNLWSADVSDAGATYGSLTIALTPRQRAALTSSSVIVGVRPGSLAVATEGGLDALVDVVEELGDEAFVYGKAIGTGNEVVARTEGMSGIKKGDRISLIPSMTGLHLFDPATGARVTA
jgi:multiple sugar transport system ATP-binding protein